MSALKLLRAPPVLLALSACGDNVERSAPAGVGAGGEAGQRDGRGEGEGEASGDREVAQGRPREGFIGLMYTTWKHDYDALEDYAVGARRAWER